MATSLDQTYADINAKAKAANAASGYSGMNNLLWEKTPTGWQSAQDPAWTSANVSRWDKPTAAGATRWSSEYPGSAFYAPKAGGPWQEITEGMLSNPEVARTVMGAGTSGPSAGAWAGLRSKIDPNVMKGIEGSSFSLAPEVLSKMWR